MDTLSAARRMNKIPPMLLETTVVYQKDDSCKTGERYACFFRYEDCLWKSWRFVKIEGPAGTICRKLVSQKDTNPNQIYLGLRSMRELGCYSYKDRFDAKVNIGRTNWFVYFWKNMRSPQYVLTPKFHDQEILDKTQEYEQQVYVYSKTMATQIFEPDDLSIDQYIRIKYGKKKIYRKCSGYRSVKSGEITLGNRSLRELGFKIVDEHSKVQIAKSNWLCYQYFNSDKSLRATCILAALGFICSIASLIISILGS